MVKRPDTNAQRLKRHKRVRAKISGTPERPRLNVFRSKRPPEPYKGKGIKYTTEVIRRKVGKTGGKK